VNAEDSGGSPHVSKHDRYQFEIKLNHEFKDKARQERYRVETFFFLPNNLDINRNTYGKKEFYRDRLLYLRFRTPRFSLASLVDPDNRRSPLNRVGERLDAFERSSHRTNADSLEYEIKLLGCIFKSTVRDHLARVYPSFFPCPSKEDPRTVSSECETLLGDFASRCRDVLSRYRGFRERFLGLGQSPRLELTYLITDEYMSLLLEWRCLQLLGWIASFPYSEKLVQQARIIEKLVEDETSYRKVHYPDSTLAKVGDNELFLFRFGVLKKYVAGVLHLNVRLVEEGRGIQQLAFALSAGVAMLFATTIAFYYQRIYGTLSLTFFVALVVSYMFKDRIKALLQGYLQSLLSRTLFDQAMQIFHSFRGNRIGVCREVVSFVEEAGLDPHVLRLRNRDHLTEIENDWRLEKILRYVREITIDTTQVWVGASRKNGLTDILRFNIRNFLEKMDEPNKSLLYLQDGRVEHLQAMRVYHVNLVLKILHGSRIQYERIRLVLTQEGIKRVESVVLEERHPANA